MKKSSVGGVNACSESAKAANDACRVALDGYKSFAKTEKAAYSQANAKKVYGMVKGCKPVGEINLFVRDGWVYLYPATGNGVDADLRVLNDILNKYALYAECV